MARAWDTLLKRLGYTRYVAQGGDWGAFVVDQMGLKAPAELLAIHTDMPATVPTDINNALSRGDPAPAGLWADEQHACQQLARNEILDNITLYWLTKTGSLLHAFIGNTGAASSTPKASPFRSP
jgi:pimeloyl-ACP methyl ester carboxylesterase